MPRPNVPCLARHPLAALAVLGWAVVPGVAVIAEHPASPIAPPAPAADHADRSAAYGADDWTVLPVGGSPIDAVERIGENFRCGDCIVEEALPVGYPRPTAPGAIELKRYPSVRRAEIVMARPGNAGEVERSNGFWPLFRHIQEREIAMTSPVEVDYRGLDSGASTEADAWSMSFLYRTPELGPTGRDGAIRVADTEPVTVVAVGLRGPYGRGGLEEGLRILEGWLDGQVEWAVAGEPRTLYYNGPYVPDARKWSEVQIPVRRTSGATGDPTTNRPSVGRTAPETPPAGPTHARARAAMTMLERAVEQGATRFNVGDVAGCCAIYEMAARGLLLGADTELEAAVREGLAAAIERSVARPDRDAAWDLRGALDAAYERLAEQAETDRKSGSSGSSGSSA